MREKHSFVYSVRNELLSSFGFRTYKQYLQSEEWAAIRADVLEEYPECICCDNASQVVHHVKYDSATLLGVHSYHLAPLCHACHQHIEIDDSGHKGSLGRANTLMFEMARKKAPKQQWLQRFYKGRKGLKTQRQVDLKERYGAWRRKQEEKKREPARCDYSGVFWIRARRRR